MTELAPAVPCPKCRAPSGYIRGEECRACGYQWFDTDAIMDGVRAATREMAAQLQAATAAGLGPAVILPEMIKIVRESGVEIDLGKLRKILPAFT